MADAERPGSLAAALITLQTRLPRITKDAEGQAGQRVTKYLSLSALHAIVMPLLADLGLYWYCSPTIDGDRFVLFYKLAHEGTDGRVSGEITGCYPLPESGGSQALGSAITYARRYALTAVLGIAPADDDDDGHAAQTEWRPPANPRTRKAQRSHGTPDDDPWYDQSPDVPDDKDAPGTITDKQRARLMAAFNRAGILERQDRLAYAMSKLDLPELASSNDLSMRQAGQLIAALESEGDS